MDCRYRSFRFVAFKDDSAEAEASLPTPPSIFLPRPQSQAISYYNLMRAVLTEWIRRSSVQPTLGGRPDPRLMTVLALACYST